MRKLKVTEMGRLSVEEFHEARKMPLVIVLDDIRSAYNVGSIFRTADAFRMAKLVLCGITGQPPSVEIHKTALGAEESVVWEYSKMALDAVRRLKEEGYRVWAVEQAVGSTSLEKFDYGGCPTAIVLGNEVMGVRQEVVDECDGCLEIPQYGTKHSLNVSCAGAIVMWEFARQYMKGK